MKACSKCKELKSRDSFSKRAASHDGLAPLCNACKSAAAKLRYERDEEFRNKAKARVQQRPIEARRESNRTWYANNTDAHIERSYNNARRKKDASPAWRNAWNVWTKMTQKNRVLDRRTFNETLAFYELAHSLGDGYVVDHIIPLRGKTVSGLHVPQNLQVLTWAANELKGGSLHPAWEAAGLKPLTNSESGL